MAKDLSKSTHPGTNFKRSTYGGGWFKEIEYRYNGIVWAIIWDQNKAIDIWEWSVTRGGRLGRFYCKFI